MQIQTKLVRLSANAHAVCKQLKHKLGFKSLDQVVMYLYTKAKVKK